MNAITPSRRRLVSFKVGLTYLGCGRTRAYRLIDEGRIVAVKDGARTKIDLDSIEAYHATLPRIMPRAS
jgi:excisionase family DNA binding protein